MMDDKLKDKIKEEIFTGWNSTIAKTLDKYKLEQCDIFRILVTTLTGFLAHIPTCFFDNEHKHQALDLVDDIHKMAKEILVDYIDKKVKKH